MRNAIIILLVTLCTLTNVKLYDIQPFEVALILLSPIIFTMMSRSGEAAGFRNPAVRKLLPQTTLFLFFCFVGALLSLRLTFFPPPDVGILKTPPYASFVRLVQVTLSFSSMFVLAAMIGRDVNRLRIACRYYVFAALIASLWGIASFIAWRLGLELGGAYSLENVLRIRGFFVEGGPFGTYLASAIIVQAFRYFYLREPGRGMLRLQAAVLLVALMGAQSKAAVLLALLALLYWMVRERRLGFISYCLLALLPVIAASNVYEGINGYIANHLRFYSAAWERPEDVNLVMGRMMGSVLVPRMVEQHPLIGVGIGNYALVRNDPAVLQGLPANDGWDLHGLGILGYFAELGVPLALFAIWIYAGPWRFTRRGDTWTAMLAIFPLLAATFGVQFNFAYPWLIGGIALSVFSIAGAKRKAPPNRVPVVPGAPLRPAVQRQHTDP